MMSTEISRYTGEMVSGHVLLALSQDFVIQDISIGIKGVYVVTFEKRVEGKILSQAVETPAKIAIVVSLQFLQDG